MQECTTSAHPPAASPFPMTVEALLSATAQWASTFLCPLSLAPFVHVDPETTIAPCLVPSNPSAPLEAIRLWSLLLRARDNARLVTETTINRYGEAHDLFSRWRTFFLNYTRRPNIFGHEAQEELSQATQWTDGVHQA